MSQLKLGQSNQILFTAYPSGGTRKVKSGVTASQISGSRSLFGIIHGTGAAVKKPISIVPSLVRSGIFRATIKSGEISNFDAVLIHFETNAAGSAADYNELFFTVVADDSDLLSAMTAVASLASDAHSAAAQANSRALVVQSMASDAASAAAQANSRALVNQSVVSDIYSAVILTQSMASDAASAAAQGNSRALVIQSMASDAHSAATQANSRALVNQSVVSDLYSAALLIQSLASDAHSAAAQGNSRALVIQSMASDAASAAAQANSRALVNQSVVSDLYSAALLIQSLASDAHSAATQANSRALVNQSRSSDIYSLLSDYVSDFGSRIPATLTTLTGVPADAPSLNAAIMFLFHAQKFTTRRNASQVTIGASDGSTMATATVAFNAGTSTFTRGTFA